ncbi:DUF397 domain-containing protein [Catellatospora vulcania]|uniref:DUF397 domain-containing protein n=1 Tax=Catellatospora vulcania TaxID=1460450 RepID=UPI0012D40500|nr:DUF397 domain-containing protein [Catellatospora vulcania]
MSEYQQDRHWRRSSRCESGQCVEVCFDGELVLVRSSKDPDGPWLTFDADEWRAFTAGLAAGELRA